MFRWYRIGFRANTKSFPVSYELLSDMWSFTLEIGAAYFASLKGNFSIDDGNGSENVSFKVNCRFFNLCRVYSNLLNMAAKCRRISQKLISWAPHSSLEREKEIRRRLFTSSIKLAIRHFHVVVVQGRWRNVPKSMMHVQSCCFANINLLLFWRPRYCRRRRC